MDQITTFPPPGILGSLARGWEVKLWYLNPSRSHRRIGARDSSSWDFGPYKSPPHSANYSVLALYFLRCVSSKTGLCEPRQTEALNSNYCFEKYLVLQQCSGWCRRIFSRCGLWVLDLLPQSVRTLLLIYCAKGRFLQPLFCHCRAPFCKCWCPIPWD